MGLDMYLSRKSPDVENMEEVGYWRKANAIHGWFEDHIPGEFECLTEYPITKDMLLELRRDCQMVIDSSELVPGPVVVGSKKNFDTGKWEPMYDEGRRIKDPSLAQEILPCRQGFFFGSQEYASWYLDDLEETVKIIDKVLEDTDFNTEQIFYSAWW